MTAQSVVIQAPIERCFAYLADPRNRPEWQSSLRRVQTPDVEPHLGLRWRDVTVVGIKPDMEITAMKPFRLWQERGSWRGVQVLLTLRFTAVGSGTRVSAETQFNGGLVAWFTSRLAPVGIAADLARAARILERA